MTNVISVHRVACSASTRRQRTGWIRVSRNSTRERNPPRRVGELADNGSASASPRIRDVTVHAHSAGPPWDARMFRQHVLNRAVCSSAGFAVYGSRPRGTSRDQAIDRAADFLSRSSPDRWAAINHFSDSDLEIDEKSKALQRSITRFEQTYYMISIAYWSVWLTALISGNAMLTKISSFSVFCWAMLAASFSFCAYFMARMIKAVGRPHDLLTAIQSDMSGLNRYSWRTLFWLGFALFYVAPTSPFVSKYLGSFGTVMCFYGLILVASSALLIKTWTFMGDPNIPMRLISVGPYSLLRHPQALGNLLFVCGFALTGGSLWSAVAFVASGVLYARNIVPLEEQMLTEAFPNSYTHYCEQVPRFSGALLLLLVVQTVMMIRYGIPGAGTY